MTTANTGNTPTATPLTLPLDGFSRLSQILPFLPIGESTFWKWVKSGKAPQPIKLSSNVSVFSNRELHDWFNEIIANGRKEQASNGKAK